MSSLGMMPPPVTRMSSRPGFIEQLFDARKERHVRAAQDREPDDVDVFLNGGGRDHLRRLVQAGVDDFHAGIAKRGGDDLGATVVAVEAGLGYEDADRARHSCGKPSAASHPVAGAPRALFVSRQSSSKGFHYSGHRGRRNQPERAPHTVTILEGFECALGSADASGRFAVLCVLCGSGSYGADLPNGATD